MEMSPPSRRNNNSNNMLLLTLLLICCSTQFGMSFTVQPISIAPSSCRSTLLQMAQAQPETQIKTGVKTVTTKKEKQAQKQEVKSSGPASKRMEDFEDAPMYKLMLLQDSGADVEHVISRLCAVCEGMDEDQASTVFKQAQAAGKAMCGKYPYERAELFKEQLQRSTPMIIADMEKD